MKGDLFLDNLQFVIDFTAVDALDRLITGYDLTAVKEYLQDASVRQETAISSYLCKMTYRLALLDLDVQTRSRVYEDIILLAEENERNLYNEV